MNRRGFIMGLSSILGLGRKSIMAKKYPGRYQEKEATAPKKDTQLNEKDLAARLFDQFYLDLEKSLKGVFPGEESAIVQEVKNKTDEIKSTNKNWISDPPSVFNLALTAMAVAAYRILSEKMGGEEEVLKIVRHAFFEGQQQNQAKEFFRAMMAKSADPFLELVTISKAKESGQYGRAFVFEREKDDDRFYFLNVKKCFYHEFFSAQGVPQLTPVFCDWDNVWGDELKDGRYGVVFERPETIGHGGRACRFQFTRVAPQ